MAGLVFVAEKVEDLEAPEGFAIGKDLLMQHRHHGFEGLVAAEKGVHTPK